MESGQLPADRDRHSIELHRNSDIGKPCLAEPVCPPQREIVPYKSAMQHPALFHFSFWGGLSIPLIDNFLFTEVSASYEVFFFDIPQCICSWSAASACGGGRAKVGWKSPFHDSRKNDILHWKLPSRSSFSEFCVFSMPEIYGICDRGLT